METDRLLLRPFTGDDFEDLNHIFSDAKTMRFWPATFSREEARGWLDRSITHHAEHGYGRMAVVQKQTGVLVGDCGIVSLEINGALENDLGYIIHHAFWNRGYATEAAAAQLDFGLNALHLTRICANMPAEHGASRRVAEKLGMRYSGEFLNIRNRMIPTCLYVSEAAA